MEIICQNCEKKLNIPDDKIPENAEKFSVTCPKCNEKNSVSLKSKDEDSMQESDSSADESGPTFADLYSYDETLKRALVCEDNPEMRLKISSVLKDLSYIAEIPKDSEDTFNKVKYDQYDLVILNELFSGSTPDNNEILDYFQTMPTSQRRNSFVMLLSKNVKTKHNMQAFSRSVELVVNIKDIQNLKQILKKALNDYDLFYRTFKTIQHELGKR